MLLHPAKRFDNSKSITMNVQFDTTSLEILETLGYKYFCNKEVPPPYPDPNEGLCAYWEILPFKSKAKALRTYLDLREVDSNNQLWTDIEWIDEMAEGMFGINFSLNLDYVFS
jgi:hypothetical protein